MLLSDYLSRYNQSHDIRPSTLEHYHWVLASFERYAGAVDTQSLSAALVDGWLLWLRECGRSPWTIKQRKISLLVLWRAAWQDGLAPPLQPVRRLRPLHHAPQAWTVAEVQQLIRAADDTSSFWGSLVRSGYDTGLRLGDLLALGVADVSPQLALLQGKTQLPVACQLRPATLDAIHRHLGGRTAGPVWLWPHRREAFYRRFRQLVRDAGIRPGTFRWLRRSAATACERVQPGTGQLLLGHASRSTTEAWYIDRSQLGQAPLPPL